jgi:NitT/TauT family transport system substrate-binding protein
LAIAACGGDDDEPEGDSGGGGDAAAESMDIQFGISVTTFTPNWYPWAVAEELGYFKDEKLNVELVNVDGSGTLTEQIAAGNVPLGAPSLGAVVEARGAGLELVDYYAAGYLYAFGLWVPEDSDIQDVADLEGTRIGITAPGGGETAVVRAALSDAGVDPVAGAQLIPIGEGEATTADAIQKGRVDAYAASRFDLYALQLAGLELRELTPEKFEDLPGRSLITTPDVLESEREALVRFGRAYAKATLFCSENEEACDKIVRETGPESFVDTNDAGESQGSLVFEEELATHVIPPEGEPFGAHQMDKYQQFIDIFAESSETFKPFEAGDFVTDELLPEINEFDREEVIQEAKSFEG